MKQLKEVLKEFEFSEEFQQMINNADTYDTFLSIPETVSFEIEQQDVVSTNNIIFSSNGNPSF